MNGKKPPTGKFGHRKKSPEDVTVELDTAELAKEQTEQTKPAPVAQPPEPVKVEEAAPSQVDPEPPVRNKTRWLPRIKKLFSWKVIIAGTIALAIYGFHVITGVENALVAPSPVCKNSAEAVESSPPYKELPMPEAAAPMLELGITCNLELRCWARSRPWVELSARRDFLFPKTPWGNAYKAGAGLYLFHDSAKNELRLRPVEITAQGKVVLGLQECVFKATPEQAGIAKYRVATWIAAATASAYASVSASGEEEKPVAPQVGGGNEKPWNIKLFDRVREYFNSGKF